MAGKKIGVLGGSFNPLHYGHLGVARNLVDAGVVDETWLSLSPLNPFKSEQSLMNVDRRLELITDALSNETSVKVTDIELQLPLPSYTIDTLDKLSELHPDYRFRWIIGADNLESFQRWKDWERILKDYGLIVYPRGSAVVELPACLQPYASNIEILTGMPLYHISSTQIRESAQN